MRRDAVMGYGMTCGKKKKKKKKKKRVKGLAVFLKVADHTHSMILLYLL
jgi:hypothetical protein